MRCVIGALCLVLALASCGKKKKNSCAIALREAPAQDSAFIFVASAFTPNGDGVNDDFFVYSEHIQSLKFEVYDAAHELLQQSEQLQGRISASNVTVNPGATTLHYKLIAHTINGHDISRCGIIYALNCLPEGFDPNTVTFGDQFNPADPGTLLYSSDALTACKQ